MTDFDEEADIYDGEPDEDVRRYIEGEHDDAEQDGARLAFVAQDQRTVAQTLAWYREHQDGDMFDPDGMCLKICRYARNIAAKYPSAKKAQDATPSKHRVYKIEDLKQGMVVYFDTVGDSNPYGHIVTVAGRVEGVPRSELRSLIVWSNSVKANKIVRVTGDYFGRYWGDKFVFGATWLNGQELKFPVPAPPQPKPADDKVLVHMMLAPLQFTDPISKRASDIGKVFARAKNRNVSWIFGTEAWEKDTRAKLKAACDKYGYRLFYRSPDDVWIAVKRSINTGGVEVEYEGVVSGAPGHGPRGVLAVSFNTHELGRITLLACHYVLAKQQENQELNKKLSKQVGRFIREHAKGSNKVFYGGDQNILDRTADTFFGQPMTSIQDELKRWENTGHGQIDVIASCDWDGNVVGNYVRVQNDEELPLHMDHFLLEAGYNIKSLK